MKILKAEIDGVFIIKGNIFKDNRGEFLKVFNKDLFSKNNLDSNFQESYFSISDKGVIRGMHFQTPPMEHTKLVYVSKGKITDVLLDIRKGSSTYGKYLSINISYEDGVIIYIPKGIAHGFISLENNTIVNYMQTTGYSPNNDKGILYNSFGYKWNNINNIIISNRDNTFGELNNFDSPFIFGINC